MTKHKFDVTTEAHVAKPVPRIPPPRTVDLAVGQHEPRTAFLPGVRRPHRGKRQSLPLIKLGTSTGRAASVQRRLAGCLVALICCLIAWHVVLKVQTLSLTSALGLYTVLVCGYVISRFILAAFYRPPSDIGHQPTVAIIVPAYNEGEAVARTINSCVNLKYPRSKIEIVVVNDGSTDDTLDHMYRAAAAHPSGVVRCIDLGSNQGKRAAMAAGIRASSAEVIVFVDSDSMPATGAVHQLVQGFIDPKVGAISGLTYVRNVGTNTLTRMQAARYYVSFQLLKSAESVVGAVACCSGCFAAYRREAVAEVLTHWEHQKFLGVECTYGDDRALTNMLLKRKWKTIYDSKAEAWTDAPDEYRKFFRQQLRWKKSWAREGPLLITHLWWSRPFAFPFALVQVLAGLLSPVVLFVNITVHPLAGSFPVIYALGTYLIAMAYAMTHRAYRSDGTWKYAFVGTFFYIAFSPQLLWAIVRIRDGKWGTRGPDLSAPVENAVEAQNV